MPNTIESEKITHDNCQIKIINKTPIWKNIQTHTAPLKKFSILCWEYSYEATFAGSYRGEPISFHSTRKLPPTVPGQQPESTLCLTLLYGA